MKADNLNNDTFNNDIGIFITRSGPITIGDTFSDGKGCLIKATTGGTLAYENELTGRTGVTYIESGEMMPVACTKILNLGTSASGLYWHICDPYPFKKVKY